MAQPGGYDFARIHPALAADRSGSTYNDYNATQDFGHLRHPARSNFEGPLPKTQIRTVPALTDLSARIPKLLKGLQVAERVW
jgi:hypothetical protein